VFQQQHLNTFYVLSKRSGRARIPFGICLSNNFLFQLDRRFLSHSRACWVNIPMNCINTFRLAMSATTFRSLPPVVQHSLRKQIRNAKVKRNLCDNLLRRVGLLSAYHFDRESHSFAVFGATKKALISAMW
jgi:hypothetical protein